MVSDRMEKLRMEMRRGTLILAVLQALREEAYGYSLRKKLHAAGLEIEESTLYPLIRRLEEQHLLTSRWSLSDEGRKRRYYATSEEGQAVLKSLHGEWEAINAAITKLEQTRP